MVSSQQTNYIDMKYREAPNFSVRYTSGYTVYDEALIGERLIGRYWSTDGHINPEKVFDPAALRKGVSEEVDQRKRLPLHAFHLEIDGQSCNTHWSWMGAHEEQKTDRGAQHYVIELSHKVRPIRLRVHTLLNGTPFLVRWLEITNTSEKHAALSSVSPWSGLLWATEAYKENLPEGIHNVFTLGYFSSSTWRREGTFVWKPLSHLTTRIEGLKGHSGWGCPFFIVRNEVTGEYFVGHLAWSGNWQIDFLCDQDPFGQDPVLADHPAPETAYLFFKVGPSASAPQRIIAPGESVITPAVHLGHLQGDLDTCVQTLHNHLRRFILPSPPKERGYLVEHNYMADFTDNWNEAHLLREVDLAADLGCEVFLIDAGWSGRNTREWLGSVGDWDPGSWTPQGLEHIREYVREKGLLFGLWVEIEAIGRDSNLFKEHPDWIATYDGKPVWSVLGKDVHGLLDLTKPKVASWVESKIVHLIKQYDLDLLRLDFNVVYTYEMAQTIHEGFIENTLWRHYEILYAIFERVRRGFPNVILQQCAAGGCRNDLGIASRFHEGYLTDASFIPRSLKTFNARILTLPPEFFVISVGTAFPYYHRGTLDSQLRTSLFSHVFVRCVAPTLEELSPERRERYIHYIELYKNFVRPMLPTCRVFHHAPITARFVLDDWLVLEYAAEDASKDLALIFRLEGAKADEYHFRPRGLDINMTYKVTFDNTGKSVNFKGSELEQNGLMIRVESIFASELLLFEAV